MHKRVPLLRPSKTGRQDVSSTTINNNHNNREQQFRHQIYNKSIRGRKSITKILALVCVFGALVYIEKLTHEHGDSVNKKKVVISMPSHDPISKTTSSIDQKEEQQVKATDKISDSNSEYKHPNYHLIFSTDCSAFQHWQSYLMFHSALKVNQPGTITRIASGCSDEEAKTATQWHKDHVTDVMGERFKLHLTPHFSSLKNDEGKKVGDYKFFNKPFGLLHWLENADDFKEGNPEDDVVILIDPDMILLRPITGDFSDPDNVLVGRMHQRERKYYVKHGAPFAQTYGFGTQWVKKLDLNEIAGPDSPAKNVNHADAAAFYPVGPPYIATMSDMIQIARKWTEFVPRVHKQYPYLLAEMFAFCVAAAHLELKHQLIDSLMISNTFSGGEGWPMVDAITKDTVPSLCEFASQPDHSQHPVPSVIHYCQHYAIGKFFFGKRRMVKDFFECESPLMEFPPMDIIETTDFSEHHGERKELSTQQARRHGFVTCGILGALNDAGTFFKEHSCNGTGNIEKKTKLT